MLHMLCFTISWHCKGANMPPEVALVMRNDWLEGACFCFAVSVDLHTALAWETVLETEASSQVC